MKNCFITFLNNNHIREVLTLKIYFRGIFNEFLKQTYGPQTILLLEAAS